MKNFFKYLKKRSTSSKLTKTKEITVSQPQRRKLPTKLIIRANNFSKQSPLPNFSTLSLPRNKHSTSSKQNLYYRIISKTCARKISLKFRAYPTLRFRLRQNRMRREKELKDEEEKEEEEEEEEEKCRE